jgi:hypothetical protein
MYGHALNVFLSFKQIFTFDAEGVARANEFQNWRDYITGDETESGFELKHREKAAFHTLTH